MYRLEVFYKGERTPHATIELRKAAEVLSRISELLAEHHTCEHILVTFQNTRLFAVDCAGNRLP